MRKYIFEVEVEEGYDEFWESVDDGDIDPVRGLIESVLSDNAIAATVKAKKFIKEY